MLILVFSLSSQAFASQATASKLDQKASKMAQRLQKELNYLRARANAPKVWGSKWNVKKVRAAKLANTKNENTDLELENAFVGDSVSTSLAAPIKEPQAVDKNYKRKSRSR